MYIVTVGPSVVCGVCVAYMHLDTNWSEGNVHCVWCVWACVWACGVCGIHYCLRHELLWRKRALRVHCVWCVWHRHTWLPQYIWTRTALKETCTACGVCGIHEHMRCEGIHDCLSPSGHELVWSKRALRVVCVAYMIDCLSPRNCVWHTWLYEHDCLILSPSDCLSPSVHELVTNWSEGNVHCVWCVWHSGVWHSGVCGIHDTWLSQSIWTWTGLKPPVGVKEMQTANFLYNLGLL